MYYSNYLFLQEPVNDFLIVHWFIRIFFIVMAVVLVVGFIAKALNSAVNMSIDFKTIESEINTILGLENLTSKDRGFAKSALSKAKEIQAIKGKNERDKELDKLWQTEILSLKDKYNGK